MVKSLMIDLEWLLVWFAVFGCGFGYTLVIHKAEENLNKCNK